MGSSCAATITRTTYIKKGGKNSTKILATKQQNCAFACSCSLLAAGCVFISLALEERGRWVIYWLKRRQLRDFVCEQLFYLSLWISVDVEIHKNWNFKMLIVSIVSMRGFYRVPSISFLISTTINIGGNYLWHNSSTVELFSFLQGI